MCPHVLQVCSTTPGSTAVTAVGHVASIVVSIENDQIPPCLWQCDNPANFHMKIGTIILKLIQHLNSHMQPGLDR